MDIEAAVFGGIDEAGWDEEAEGDGNDYVDGVAIWFGHLVGGC
jgi:hypothetical protein